MPFRQFAAAALLVAGVAGCNPAPTSEQSGPDTGVSDVALGWTAAKAFVAPAPSGTVLQGRVPIFTQGQTVLINFWGSWCGPCKEEMPLLQRLADETNVQVIGVTRDRYEKYAANFLAATGAGFPNVQDPDGDYMAKFSAVVPRWAVPSSVLVVDGMVVAAHIGPFKKWNDLTTNRPR